MKTVRLETSDSRRAMAMPLTLIALLSTVACAPLEETGEEERGEAESELAGSWSNLPVRKMIERSRGGFLLVTQTATGEPRLLARKTSFTADTAFGTRSSSPIPFPASVPTAQRRNALVTSLRELPDGRVVVAGWYGPNDTDEVDGHAFLAAFAADGKASMFTDVDEPFVARDGSVCTDISGSVGAVGVEASGTLVLAVSRRCGTRNESDQLFLRYSLAGLSANKEGRVLAATSPRFIAFMDRLPDGRFIVQSSGTVRRDLIQTEAPRLEVCDFTAATCSILGKGLATTVTYGLDGFDLTGRPAKAGTWFLEVPTDGPLYAIGKQGSVVVALPPTSAVDERSCIALTKLEPSLTRLDATFGAAGTTGCIPTAPEGIDGGLAVRITPVALTDDGSVVLSTYHARWSWYESSVQDFEQWRYWASWKTVSPTGQVLPASAPPLENVRVSASVRAKDGSLYRAVHDSQFFPWASPSAWKNARVLRLLP